MSFERHEAYAKRFPFLSDVKLARGVVDIARDLPPRDLYLLAPAANLVARADLHPALVPLLMSAVTTAPPPRGYLSTSSRFPNADFGEFPLDPAARSYFQSGPPLLDPLPAVLAGDVAGPDENPAAAADHAALAAGPLRPAAVRLADPLADLPVVPRAAARRRGPAGIGARPARPAPGRPSRSRTRSACSTRWNRKWPASRSRCLTWPSSTRSASTPISCARRSPGGRARRGRRFRARRNYRPTRRLPPAAIKVRQAVRTAPETDVAFRAWVTPVDTRPAFDETYRAVSRLGPSQRRGPVSPAPASLRRALPPARAFRGSPGR